VGVGLQGIIHLYSERVPSIADPLHVAQQCRFEQLAAARETATENGIPTVKFNTADVGKFLLEHPEYQGKMDTVILDPPRGGIAPKALKRTIELEAKTIVYISCNPATLARDTEVLQNSGYRLLKFSLVDQFPHTGHVEAVALFQKQ
jgi:tRNA/tmRNA/rRNA uracil-C5-methylase (TrmA/RlmC/RlmD family)